jgi:ribose 1,5-bisphosphokinase
MSKLIYIVGASGVGKDSLMHYARQRLNGSLQILFAHRYITRPVAGNSENHVAITPEEFQGRKAGGLFALDWESHDLYYGIGKEINDWMISGFHVVVNGSRQYLPLAKERYPQLVTIVIEADPEIILHRLQDRGREDAAAITSRIKRQPPLDKAGLIRITNNGLLEEAGETLLGILKGFA